MNWIISHQAILGAAGVWVLSAAISNMPEPDTTSSKAYRWLYGFLHTAAGNLDKLGSAMKPPLK